MKSFDHWLLKKEGPLDDPKHALFGDFDHIPWLKDDVKFYAKQRADNGGKKPPKVDPYATTLVFKGDTKEMGSNAGADDSTVCMKRIQGLEKRLNSVETALKLHGSGHE